MRGDAGDRDDDRDDSLHAARPAIPTFHVKQPSARPDDPASRQADAFPTLGPGWVVLGLAVTIVAFFLGLRTFRRRVVS